MDYFLNFFRSSDDNKDKTHGNHVLIDLVWNINEYKPNEYELGNTIFKIMEDGIKKTNMNIVFKKLCIFEEGKSPPGFTAFFCLDESHASMHAYTDRGWLSFDCYTCGETDPNIVTNYVKEEMVKIIPSLVCTYNKTHKRFHYL
jgi:S-adenosylmethionine/arginine decarboxylase-like enzyme